MNVPPAPSPKDEPPGDRPDDPTLGQPGGASHGHVRDDAVNGVETVEGDGCDRVPAEGSGAAPDDGKGTGFLAVLQSVAAAGIGVQSSRNRKRDFERGKPVHFIVGGLIGTALFLLAVWLFVQMLIATAPG